MSASATNCASYNSHSPAPSLKYPDSPDITMHAIYPWAKAASFACFQLLSKFVEVWPPLTSSDKLTVITALPKSSDAVVLPYGLPHPLLPMLILYPGFAFAKKNLTCLRVDPEVVSILYVSLSWASTKFWLSESHTTTSIPASLLWSVPFTVLNNLKDSAWCPVS